MQKKACARMRRLQAVRDKALAGSTPSHGARRLLVPRLSAPQSALDQPEERVAAADVT